MATFDESSAASERRSSSESEVRLVRALASEGLGTALLLVAVVGSGIMAERLSGGNVAIALLANAIATGAALFVLILVFGPISGAHFNPVVTLAEAVLRKLPAGRVGPYVLVQGAGALAGVALTHAMFELPTFTMSTHARAGTGQLVGEIVATFGLLAVVLGCSRHRPASVPAAVAAYITGAYWFTSSTSFANPAVTVARATTNTFAGIRPSDAPGFIGAQVIGAAVALVVFRWLLGPEQRREESAKK